MRADEKETLIWIKELLADSEGHIDRVFNGIGIDRNCENHQVYENTIRASLIAATIDRIESLLKRVEFNDNLEKERKDWKEWFLQEKSGF